MIVRFDATLDEVVDAGLKSLARSKSARHWRWTSHVASTFLTGLAVAGLPFLINVEPRDRCITEAVTLAILGILGVAIGYPFMYRRIIRERLRAYYREIFGKEGPFLVEIELTPEGIRTRQESAQILFEWSRIEEI